MTTQDPQSELAAPEADEAEEIAPRVRQRQVRTAEYTRLAEESTALAAASSLDNVREKHERAAATWRGLAAFDERPVTTPAHLRRT